MTKTLHIVAPTIDFNKINLESTLVTTVDSDFLKNHYHVSVADRSATDICNISQYFDCINFVPDGYEVTSDLYFETVVLLNYLSHRCHVTNFEIAARNTYISNNEIFTRPNEPVLWVFGCSHSYGTGLELPSQRYASLLSSKLGLPLKLIAQSGSSTDWSLRHMLNSCIQPQDIVVWQLTTAERLTELDSYTCSREQLLKVANKTAVDFYTDLRLFYKQISLLNAGVQHLKNTKAKFAIISFSGHSELYYQLLSEYTKHPEYVYSPNLFVDLAKDNMHAGPLSNQYLAQHLFTHLN